MASNLEVGH